MISQRFTFALFIGILSGFVSAAESSKVLVREGKDDISGKAWHSVAIFADDNKSLLQVKVFEGGIPSLGIVPDDTIFPDKTDASAKIMQVGVTLRSTAMDKPITKMWNMGYMKYGTAVAAYRPEEIKQVFGGDSVTIQFDKVGRRYRFPTSGDGLEKLKETVSDVLSHAPTPEQDKARVDELLRVHGVAGNGPTSDAKTSQEPGKQKKSDATGDKLARARAEGEKYGGYVVQQASAARGTAKTLGRGDISGLNADHEKRAAAQARRKGFSGASLKAFLESYGAVVADHFQAVGAGR